MSSVARRFCVAASAMWSRRKCASFFFFLTSCLFIRLGPTGKVDGYYTDSGGQGTGDGDHVEEAGVELHEEEVGERHEEEVGKKE